MFGLGVTLAMLALAGCTTPGGCGPARGSCAGGDGGVHSSGRAAVGVFDHHPRLFRRGGCKRPCDLYVDDAEVVMTVDGDRGALAQGLLRTICHQNRWPKPPCFSAFQQHLGRGQPVCVHRTGACPRPTARWASLSTARRPNGMKTASHRVAQHDKNACHTSIGQHLV